VKKKSDKWRICNDFTNLNQVYPKGSFPLLMIDQLVDATAGHELLSFMNTCSRYNQIKMHPKEKQDDIHHRSGHLLHKVMPFRLKNVGATF